MRTPGYPASLEDLASSVGVALLSLLLCSSAALCADWPQWGGRDGRNMASEEKGLPDSFVPGEKDPQSGRGVLATAGNVQWAARLGTMTCSTPAVAGGRVFIGTASGHQGVLLCLDEATGKTLWRLSAPPRTVPKVVDGRERRVPALLPTVGLSSSPAVDGDRVYVVTHRCEVVCLDVQGLANGNDGPFQDERRYSARPDKESAVPNTDSADIVWGYDMWNLGVRPTDACNSSVMVHGDLLYVCTSNGVDRSAIASRHDELRRPAAPTAPSLIVLEKKTGRLAAVDDAQIGPRLLHGHWSSPSLGRVGDRTLVFLGGGDGVCYAFDALRTVPEKPVKLRTAWRFDCNPPEYKVFGRLDPIAHYCRGDRRRSDTLNRRNDGGFAGMSEIIATPVFHNNRVYVAIGRDPEHGRGKGALHCIDATKEGDITATGSIWSYKGMDRTLSTVSIADGLLYIADVAGRIHCLDADTGLPYWVHETNDTVWGSTLVADGKVYMPTRSHLWVLAAGKEANVLSRISLGAPMWASPVAANGTLFIASARRLWAVRAAR